MCYGGGFGTMPAFAADYFGSANIGPIYGLMLTAWGAASAFGPLLVANLRQSSGGYRSGFHALAIIVFIATLIPLTVRPPSRT
jgi:OFA family oxalate/formate antiporter-like MFS transporter